MDWSRQRRPHTGRTFGRLDNDWKLKEVVPAARGNEMIAAENVDEGSSPEQLQWFYKQTRAV